MSTTDLSEINAFVPGSDVSLRGRPTGPLSGLTFAAKDLFDVSGYVTGAGNADWARTHTPAAQHAWAVQTLLDAGADLIGKTITDELSLGIFGENPFYGTPVNVNAPGRVPGGSSSGSAAAVAAGLCDTAIGTDTGGSVRVPASFCGLYGIRPTHARVPTHGMLAQAPASDTTGWFARDAETFARVSAAMLNVTIPSVLPTKLLVAPDAFAFADASVSAALQDAVERLAALIGNRSEAVLAPVGFATWSRAQRTLQPAQAWLTFRDWLDEVNPRLAFSVIRNLLAGAQVSPQEHEHAELVREEARGHINALLPPGTIMCLPTTPFPAPPRAAPYSSQAKWRARINCLCSHGGLTGVPQVSMPLGCVDGLPVGLSIIGARGEDATLVAVARALEAQ
jgi:amidase